LILCELTDTMIAVDNDSC